MLGTIILAILEFIVLVLGFAAGFWLLIAATGQEGWKKTIGGVFGWILIIYALIITAMICFQWIDYMRTGRLIDMQGCPMHQMMQQQGSQGQMQQRRMPMQMQQSDLQMPQFDNGQMTDRKGLRQYHEKKRIIPSPYEDRRYKKYEDYEEDKNEENAE